MGDSEKGRVQIGGTVDRSQIAVGSYITQTSVVGHLRETVTDGEIRQLTAALATLREQVTAQVPPERQEAALDRLEELEEALVAERPELTTVQRVRDWFLRRAPQLAGAVTSLVFNPIVGKLVAAGGDALVSEFRERFGTDPTTDHHS